MQNPIPIRPQAPKADAYGTLPVNLKDPKAAEPLVDVAEYGIAGKCYYARSDGWNAPYRRAFSSASPRISVRKSVAERLARVNESLADLGIELFAYNGYRPIALQQELWDYFIAQGRDQLLDPSECDLVAFAATYCSDPRAFDPTDSRTWPTHATGGAIDCTLRSKASGGLLYMGGIFDDPDPVSHTGHFERSLQGHRGEMHRLSQSDQEALRNRRLLYWAMIGQGFANYAYEWWHFDWGTQLWALEGRAADGPREAFYGLANSE